MRSAATSMPASRPPGTAANGFQPIGASNSFTGNLDGQGHTISGLFINRPSDQNVGLISYLDAGALGKQPRRHRCDRNRPYHCRRRSSATNYGAIRNVYSSGSVTAISAGAGGLVGYNFQTLSNSYSNSAVSGPLYVGGAVGLNNIAAGPTAGSISQVYATGAVTGTGGSPSASAGWSATTATPSRNPTGIVTRRGRRPASAPAVRPA